MGRRAGRAGSSGSGWAALLVVALLAGAGALVGVRTAVAGEGVVALAPEGRPEEQLPPDLVACRSRVQAGELVVSAMNGVADDWQLASRRIDLDPSERTIEQVRVAVAETLPIASGRFERLEQARVGYDGLQGLCGDLLDASVGSRGDEAEVCIERARAVRDAVRAGDDVDARWRGYVGVMETAATADEDEYLAQWREHVDGSDEELRPFREAVDALATTPLCRIG